MRYEEYEELHTHFFDFTRHLVLQHTRHDRAPCVQHTAILQPPNRWYVERNVLGLGRGDSGAAVSELGTRSTYTIQLLAYHRGPKQILARLELDLIKVPWRLL